MTQDLVFIVYRCSADEAAQATAVQLGAAKTAEFVIFSDISATGGDGQKRNQGEVAGAVKRIQAEGDHAVVLSNDPGTSSSFGARTILESDGQLFLNAIRKRLVGRRFEVVSHSRVG